MQVPRGDERQASCPSISATLRTRAGREVRADVVPDSAIGHPDTPRPQDGGSSTLHSHDSQAPQGVRIPRAREGENLCGIGRVFLTLGAARSASSPWLECDTWMSSAPVRRGQASIQLRARLPLANVLYSRGDSARAHPGPCTGCWLRCRADPRSVLFGSVQFGSVQFGRGRAESGSLDARQDADGASPGGTRRDRSPDEREACRASLSSFRF
jgi:hypothetical protein